MPRKTPSRISSSLGTLHLWSPPYRPFPFPPTPLLVRLAACLLAFSTASQVPTTPSVNRAPAHTSAGAGVGMPPSSIEGSLSLLSTVGISIATGLTAPAPTPTAMAVDAARFETPPKRRWSNRGTWPDRPSKSPRWEVDLPSPWPQQAAGWTPERGGRPSVATQDQEEEEE